jgi:hypothetical protein
MLLRRIGYWCDDPLHPEYPDPHAWVDPDWDFMERFEVRSYVAHGTVVDQWMGFASCRICYVPNGDSDYTDGTFVWPSGLVHYLDAHAVRLPKLFVDHVIAQLHVLREAQIDSDWWLTATQP